MNNYYKQTGATVLVHDDNNRVRAQHNKQNIESILLLENDRERIDNKIEELESDVASYKKATKSAYFRNHKSFASAVVGVAIASILGKVFLNFSTPLLNFLLSTNIPNSPFGVLASIFMFQAKENSYHKFRLDKEIIDKEKDSAMTKIKNLNILKFSVNHELKVERNANLPSNEIAEFKPLYNKGIVDFDILNYYENNHDQLIDNFKKTNTIPTYKDHFHTRLLSDMVQKEIHDEVNYEDLSLKDKLKVKVKEKVNKVLK